MTDPPHAEPFAVLGMYPFESLRQAWSAFYAATVSRVRERGLDAPRSLRWDVDPHDSWLAPQLVVGMTCGWPLVTALRERVRVVGTFAHRHETAPQPHLYRSAIIAREAVPLAELSGTTAAINSADSLSGNISLLEAFDLEDAWPGHVVETGAHVASIEAVRSGAADVASIDDMTWAFQQRDAPDSLEGLHVVGRGPWVPGLPVVLPGTATDHELAVWRAAITAATQDPSLRTVCGTLLIERLVPLDLADYDLALEDLRGRRQR